MLYSYWNFAVTIQQLEYFFITFQFDAHKSSLNFELHIIFNVNMIINSSATFLAHKNCDSIIAIRHHWNRKVVEAIFICLQSNNHYLNFSFIMHHSTLMPLFCWKPKRFGKYLSFIRLILLHWRVNFPIITNI